MEIEQCFNLAMRKSTRIITQFYEERLAKVGLKVGQFTLLRAVHYRKQTTNKQLQSILVLDQTTLSRNLKPLIRDGLLTVTADEDDQRKKIISLSAEGESTYQEALPIWKDIQQSLVEKLGNKESLNILKLSDSFAKKLAQL